MNETNNKEINKEIVYTAHLHWVLFLGPVVMMLIALSVGLNFDEKPVRLVALFFLVISWVWTAMVWVTYRFSSLTIKKKQVILRTGLLVRQTVDIAVARIESIDIRQTVFGTLLHYGSLVITGTGGTRQVINYLSKPLTCRRYIEQSMHE